METTGTKTASPAVEWKLGQLFQDVENDTARSLERHALVVLNVPIRNIPVVKTLWKNSAIRIAADGGANRLYDHIDIGGDQGVSSRPTGHFFEDLDVIIGDLDSLRPEVRQYFSSLHKPAQVIFDPDQETTDFTKAVNHIRANFAADADIVAIGGLCGRVDQGISQIHHLYMFQDRPNYETGRVYLVTDQSIAFLLKAGRHKIYVGGTARHLFDKYVGIVPCKEPSVITTRGLEWDVQDWKTQFGGRISTSNHVRPGVEVVEVETTKDVIFTIALNTDNPE